MFPQTEKKKHLALYAVIAMAVFSLSFIAFSVTSQIKSEEIELPKLTQTNENETPHNLVGAYYDVQNFSSAKLLLNNKGLYPIEVRPTLYNLDGNAMEVAPVTVEADSHRFVDLREWANPGGESFRRGSLKLFHTAKDLIIGSQIYLTNESNSLSFEERLAELGKFDSRRLESIWWMPRNQAQVTIILSNTSDEMISVTAKLSKKPHHTGEPQTFSLLPHQTRVLDLKNDFTEGNQFANSEIVGLSLEHTGDKSALKAHGQIKDSQKGYSNIITFSNPNSAKSRELHGTGLHLGTIGNEQVEPAVMMKNVGSERTNVKVKVPYTRTDGTTGTVNLNSINLKAGEMRSLNMNSVVNRSRQEQIEIAGIEIEYDAAVGSVIANVQSVSDSQNQVFRVPMADPLAQVSSTGGYPWRIEETSRTVSYIKNMTDLEQDYVAFLTWAGGGRYMIGMKKIEPHKTIQIDVKKLRDEQIPDERSNIIPLNLTNGQIQWTLRRKYETGNLKNDKHALTGRSEQINTINKMSSSYACQNCCEQLAYGFVLPDGYSFEIDQTVQFVAYEEARSCYFLVYSYSIQPDTWRSNNTNVATVNGTGLVTIRGVGDAEIEAEWYVYNSVKDPYCQGPYFTGTGNDSLRTSRKRNVTAELPDCDNCYAFTERISPEADVSGKPKVQKIQYQEPGTSNFVDITDTLYVLKGTTVNFKAVPYPNNAAFPNGQPSWSGSSGATGTGQTKSVTFNTVSSSASDYKTVIAYVDSPVIVNVVVYELTGMLTPEDNFAGRSQERYGVSEVVDLNFTTMPSLTINETGSLTWKITSGNGILQNVTTDGTNNYRAPVAPSTEILKIEIIDGPSKGLGPSYTKTVVAPSGTSTRLGALPNVAHLQWTCSVTIKMDVYLTPKDVSFEQIVFLEDQAPGAVAVASGFYAAHNGAIHTPSSFWDVGPGNINDGCFAFPDRAGNDPGTGDSPVGNPPQCTTGDFKWVIPWFYQVTISTPPVQFQTVTHHQYTVPPDETWIEKAGTGPIMRRISDSTTYFP